MAGVTRHLQFRVEDDVYKACEAAAEKAGMSLSAYGAKMVAEWVGRSAEEPPKREIPRKYQIYMEKLALILASGDSQTIAAFAGSLNLAVDRLKPKPAAEEGDHK